MSAMTESGGAGRASSSVVDPYTSHAAWIVGSLPMLETTNSWCWTEWSDAKSRHGSMDDDSIHSSSGNTREKRVDYHTA